MIDASSAADECNTSRAKLFYVALSLLPFFPPLPVFPPEACISGEHHRGVQQRQQPNSDRIGVLKSIRTRPGRVLFQHSGSISLQSFAFLGDGAF
jgi:hypothetical protein